MFNTYVKHVCKIYMLNMCFVKHMLNMCLTYVKHILNITYVLHMFNTYVQHVCSFYMLNMCLTHVDIFPVYNYSTNDLQCLLLIKKVRLMIKIYH